MARVLGARRRAISEVPGPACGTACGEVRERHREWVVAALGRTRESRRGHGRARGAVVDQEGEVLVRGITIARQAITADGRSGDGNRERTGGTRGQEHELGVVADVRRSSSSGVLPGEDVAEVGAATHRDHQVQIVDVRSARSGSRRISPDECHTEWRRRIVHVARDLIALPTRRQQLTLVLANTSHAIECAAQIHQTRPLGVTGKSVIGADARHELGSRHQGGLEHGRTGSAQPLIEEPLVDQGRPTRSCWTGVARTR